MRWHKEKKEKKEKIGKDIGNTEEKKQFNQSWDSDNPMPNDSPPESYASHFPDRKPATPAPFHMDSKI